MTTNGVRPARTLPPTPSVAQVERAMNLLASEALKIPAVYREAQDIAYSTDNGDNTKVSGGSIKPTEDAVMAGLVNEEGDERAGIPAEPDRWSRDREALRSGVVFLRVSMRSVGMVRPLPSLPSIGEVESAMHSLALTALDVAAVYGCTGVLPPVMPLATALQHMGLAKSAFRSVIRAHELSGNPVPGKGRKAEPRQWVHGAAEKVATEFEHRPVPREATDRRYWPKRRT